MQLLGEFPFTELKLADAESFIWAGNSWAFHRAGVYGILVSDCAVYWYSPFWLCLAKWRRFPLQSIGSVYFRNSRWRPGLVLETSEGRFKLATPFDGYSDEMDIDRKMLETAAEVVMRAIVAHNDKQVGA